MSSKLSNLFAWVGVGSSNILGFLNSTHLATINGYLLAVIYLFTIIFLVKKFYDWVRKGINPNGKN